MVLALAAGLASTPALARDSDRSQPAEIEADRAEIDRQEGVAHYRGGAVFTQGTLRVTGERITVHAPAGRLERARAEGERAALRQETNAGRLVRARAQRIDYASEAQQITLIGHAEVVRAGERFRAHRIEYDTATDRVEAYSGDTDGRVRIRMAPEEAEDESDTGDE
jgi:lipopolysaccharide export system protein LptA